MVPGPAASEALDTITTTESEEHRQIRLNKAIDEKLHVYANAIRDYETLSQEAVPDFLPTPGILSTMKATWEGKENEWRLENSHRKRLREEIPLDMRKYMFRELNREIRLDLEKERALFSRLGMGLFGGVALILPMKMMVFFPGRNISVITTCATTLLFAVVLAVNGRGLDGKDVLAATAAYAAVMVIFVGANLDG